MAFESDGKLKDWVGTVIPGVELSLGAPDPRKTGRGLGLYLMELIQSPPPSSGRRLPLQVALRYLVTAWSDQPEDAHQMLVDLMFAAMESKDFQVEPETLPLGVWTAFGLPPRPSFILRLPLLRERPESEAKLVRGPLKIQSSPVVGFYGLLLGPDDVPLSDCRIELAALNLSTRTDYKGRFCFPTVPSAGNKELLIKAKGFELAVRSEQNYPDSESPLVIHFAPLED
jgi:hypothetical protein